jgi:hypothetical protein
MTMLLTDEEQQILQRILEGTVGDLRHEIRHTRDHDHRSRLKHRRNVVRSILSKVETDQEGLPITIQ